MFGLDTGLTLLLIVCLLAACSFEFINGFHDTANAVATVIYTNTLKPNVAVVWSGICNFIGVNVGGIAVAIGIINLLPVEALVDANIYHALSMIMALIITAIIWNLSTWYFGIPCSSSHTLIGSIFGVGLAYMFLPGSHVVALNWKKVEEVGLSLLISPVLGFGLSLLMMFILKKTIKNKTLFKEPSAKKAPPLLIRSLLVLTCTSVSFSHGSNDGQKGVGLIMMILIGIVPAHFALDLHRDPMKLYSDVKQIELTLQKVDTTELSATEKGNYANIKGKISSLDVELKNCKDIKDIPADKRFEVRKNILLIAKGSEKLVVREKAHPLKSLSYAEVKAVSTHIKAVKTYTEYAPWWVILMVSTSLGLGTMIGWKRIVTTIGEKIGKTHLSYAEGATAEIIAASTISASTLFGLPVSTTHVLSSGVAGSMVADKGLKNLQMKTIRNIGIAWLITLPVTIMLAGTLFLLFRFIFA